MNFPIKFEEFEGLFIRQNRLLKIISGIIISLLIAILILAMTRPFYFAFSSGPIFKERALLEDVCREVLVEMSKRNYSEHMIHPGLIKLIEKSEIKSWEGEILKLNQAGESNCKAIIKSASGPRAFSLVFEKSDKFPFHYRLFEINETETKEQN